jgi:uncharacterized protein (DUF608 family)
MASHAPVRLARSRELPGDASMAAFPLGGIGTGNVSLGARGELRDWEIFNGPAKGNTLPFTFFALHAAAEGMAPVAKVLESRLRPPYQRWNGYEPGAVAGLPRLRDSRLRGEYPFAWISFQDDDLPVSVSLEAFTPLVPLDAAESGLPVAVLRYRVRASVTVPVTVTVVGSLFSAVGFTGFGPESSFRQFEGTPTIEFRDDGLLRGLYVSSSLSDDHLRHGTMALATTSPNTTVQPNWPADARGMDAIWSDLCEDGRLDDGVTRIDAHSSLEPDHDDEPVMANAARTIRLQEREKPRVGSLGVVETLTPGQDHTFEFVLAWHFPNRPKAWPGATMLEETNAHEISRNFYATRFTSAWEVARHLQVNLPALERHTRDFHHSLYHSSLPAELVDAAASSLATLRSTTCFRLEDGTFAGWEGSRDEAGCCEGSCTHVWNYAQTAAFLFPELERSMRRVEFGLETDENGRMRFRTNRIFAGEPWRFRPAVDGQLGTIVRLYREWKFSGDDAFLGELWPHAAKALDFAFSYWDTDGDFLLDGRQHNTYDIDFYGPTPLANALFYAALRAGAEMAAHLGQRERAERYRDAAARGAKAMDQLLWNGEYYIQELDDIDAHPEQHGTGCLSDQLFGQLLAHVVGLGYVLQADHVRKAITSVHRYNFRSTLRNQRNLMRTYALEDEAGLVVCSWPHGGRPRRPFLYADEVWTGIEYQVAAHLIYEGLLQEGLEIVRAVRARHDGYRRSPWNEAECGYHYARSMSSWALLLAFSGFRYDATERSIAFAPADTHDEFRCFFSTGTGWGTFFQDHSGVRIELRYGSLTLSCAGFRVPVDATIKTASINAVPLLAQVERHESDTSLKFDTVRLLAGDALCVDFDRREEL